MLTTLLVLSWVVALFPRVMQQLGGLAWAAARHALGI
jgi:hypothetical protein